MRPSITTLAGMTLAAGTLAIAGVALAGTGTASAQLGSEPVPAVVEVDMEVDVTPVTDYEWAFSSHGTLEDIATQRDFIFEAPVHLGDDVTTDEDLINELTNNDGELEEITIDETDTIEPFDMGDDVTTDEDLINELTNNDGELEEITIDETDTYEPFDMGDDVTTDEDLINELTLDGSNFEDPAHMADDLAFDDGWIDAEDCPPCGMG